MNDPTIPKDRAQSCGQVQGQAAKATPGKGWRDVLKKQATCATRAVSPKMKRMAVVYLNT
jgi:hypothetical protein